MEIELRGLGKKYGNQWIFKNLDRTLASGSATAITGANGSGKSTLIKVIGTFLLPSKGRVVFTESGYELAQETIQLQINFAAPYQNLIEELTLHELLIFHSAFKKPLIQLSGMTSKLMLPTDKPISEFSSGMKQRVRLALALFFDSRVILLDEPTTNLDKPGMEWYQTNLTEFKKDRTLLIASNLEDEYWQCSERIEVLSP